MIKTFVSQTHIITDECVFSNGNRRRRGIGITTISKYHSGWTAGDIFSVELFDSSLINLRVVHIIVTDNNTVADLG